MVPSALVFVRRCRHLWARARRTLVRTSLRAIHIGGGRRPATVGSCLGSQEGPDQSPPEYCPCAAATLDKSQGRENRRRISSWLCLPWGTPPPRLSGPSLQLSVESGVDGPPGNLSRGRPSLKPPLPSPDPLHLSTSQSAAPRGRGGGRRRRLPMCLLWPSSQLSRCLRRLSSQHSPVWKAHPTRPHELPGHEP